MCISPTCPFLGLLRHYKVVFWGVRCFPPLPRLSTNFNSPVLLGLRPNCLVCSYWCISPRHIESRGLKWKNWNPGRSGALLWPPWVFRYKITFICKETSNMKTECQTSFTISLWKLFIVCLWYLLVLSVDIAVKLFMQRKYEQIHTQYQHKVVSGLNTQNSIW